MSMSLPKRFDNAIRALCPIIEDRIRIRDISPWNERALRRELVGCILGSQVRHEMAVAATENLECAGLLEDHYWEAPSSRSFDRRVLEVLSGDAKGLPHQGRYRFPKLRASQLSAVRRSLVAEPLTIRLTDRKCPRQVRHRLVTEMAGLGPKQASMFLRNVGKSYDLAILDTHVLRFLDLRNLLPATQHRISTLAGYERAESVMTRYADSVGYPAGYLDWAIWATMKAANELGL